MNATIPSRTSRPWSRKNTERISAEVPMISALIASTRIVPSDASVAATRPVTRLEICPWTSLNDGSGMRFPKNLRTTASPFVTASCEAATYCGACVTKTSTCS